MCPWIGRLSATAPVGARSACRRMPSNGGTTGCRPRSGVWGISPRRVSSRPTIRCWGRRSRWPGAGDGCSRAASRCDTHPWLADHAVAGTVLLPGTAFLELALYAGREVGCELVQELALQAPLVLDEGDGGPDPAPGGGARPGGSRAVSIHSRAYARQARRGADGRSTASAPGRRGRATPAGRSPRGTPTGRSTAGHGGERGRLEERLAALGSPEWPPPGAVRARDRGPLRAVGRAGLRVRASLPGVAARRGGGGRRSSPRSPSPRSSARRRPASVCTPRCWTPRCTGSAWRCSRPRRSTGRRRARTGWHGAAVLLERGAALQHGRTGAARLRSPRRRGTPRRWRSPTAPPARPWPRRGRSWSVRSRASSSRARAGAGARRC